MLEGMRDHIGVGKHQDVKMRMKAVVAVSDFQGADIAVDLGRVGIPDLVIEIAELVFHRVFAMGKALESLGLLIQQIPDVVPDTMPYRQRNEKDIPAQSLGPLHRFLEFGATTFRDLGCTDGTWPKLATAQKPLIERLAMSATLAEIDIGKSMSNDWSTPNHAL